MLAGKGMRKSSRNLRLGILFILPWVMGFSLMSLYPLLSSIYFSLSDYSVLYTPHFIGLQNYTDLLTDRRFWLALSNTITFAIFFIPLATVTSLSLALLLNLNIAFRGVFRTIFFLPSLVPTVCLAVLWQWVLHDDDGLVNSIIRPVTSCVGQWLGLPLQPPNWLQDPSWTKPGIVLTSLWGTGHAMVIYLAGLQDVPRQLYESAELDSGCIRFFPNRVAGSGQGVEWRIFWQIILPLSKPALIVVALFQFMATWNDFIAPLIFLMEQDQFTLALGLHSYKSSQGATPWHYLMAASTLVILPVLVLFFLAQKSFVEGISTTGTKG